MPLPRSQAAFLAVLSLIAPSSSAAGPDPAVLIVLPGAQDVKYTEEHDGTVLYRLTDPHPAKATLEQLRSRLEVQGWKPTPDDLLSPGTPNSHGDGWTSYIDGTRNDANVFHWSAGWVNAHGDRVEYWLRYEYPKGSGPTTANPPLEVAAAYMNASTVSMLREEVRRRPVPGPATR